MFFYEEYEENLHQFYQVNKGIQFELDLYESFLYCSFPILFSCAILLYAISYMQLNKTYPRHAELADRICRRHMQGASMQLINEEIMGSITPAVVRQRRQKVLDVVFSKMEEAG